MRSQFIFTLAIFCYLITFTTAGCITCTPPNKMDIDGFCSECIGCAPEDSDSPWLLGVIVGVPSGVGFTGIMIYAVKSQLAKRALITPAASSPRRSARDSERTKARHKRLTDESRSMTQSSPSISPSSTPHGRGGSFDLVLENVE